MFKKIISSKLLKMTIVCLLLANLVATIVFAGDVLEKIYVDFKMVKKIVVDGKEKVPPEDMKPFTYNGRTYVALRFVGEALGKPVNWDSKTGTVYVGNNPMIPQNKKVEDDFSKPLSNNWDLKNSSTGWGIDEQNGAYTTINYGVALWLNNDKYYNISKNYTIESKIAFTKCEYANFAGFMIGKYEIKLNPRIPSFGTSLVVVNEKARGGDFARKEIPLLESNKYYNVKVDVKEENIDIYIDGSYVTSGTLPDLETKVGLFSSALEGRAYFKDFKLTIND